MAVGSKELASAQLDGFDNERLVEGHPRRATAAFSSATRARVLHEDTAHGASRHRKEMCTVVPCNILRVDQPEIGLVDEHGCLEAVTRALSRHAALRDPVQFLVDERNQSLEGSLVAPPPFEKEPGDFRGVAQRNSTF